MTPMFVSAFAGHLRGFVDQKRALGHPYVGSIDVLRQFDTMCSREFPGRADLGQDICMAWAVKRPTEGRNALRNRTAAIREFARYLTRLGEPAYLLPPALTCKGPRHVPTSTPLTRSPRSGTPRTTRHRCPDTRSGTW